MTEDCENIENENNNRDEEKNSLMDKTDKLLMERVENFGKVPNENRKNSLSFQKILSDDGEEDDVQDIDKIMREMEITDDLSCGYWFFKGAFLQRFVSFVYFSINVLVVAVDFCYQIFVYVFFTYL